MALHHSGTLRIWLIWPALILFGGAVAAEAPATRQPLPLPAELSTLCRRAEFPEAPRFDLARGMVIPMPRDEASSEGWNRDFGPFPGPGSAILELLVSETGELVSICAMQASQPAHAAAAVRMYSGRRFYPGKIDGKDAAMYVYQPVRFLD